MNLNRTILILSALLVSIMTIGLVMNPVSAVAADKAYRLKIQSAYPRGDLSMELLNDFAATVKKNSNGRITIQVFADPELVPAEQLFEATQKGTLDMVHAVAAMWGGILPIGEVEFGLPYAYNLPGEPDIFSAGKMIRELFFNTGYVDLLREQYATQGLYWLDVHSYGPIVTMSTKKINTCDDMQGLKFRVEGSWADYYNDLGARGTYISGMEAYMGLKLGTIDASQWDVSAITGLNWHEVAPYWLLGGQNDVVVGHILFNMKSWNALPDDLKQVMTAAAEDYFNKLLKVYEGELKKVDDLIKAGKVTKTAINEDCDNKHEAAALKLWDKIGQRDPAAAKAIGIIKEWRKTLK